MLKYIGKEIINMARYLKCPFCNKEKLGIIPAGEGKSWGLVSFKTDSDPADLENILHVEVYACTECKSILLKSPEVEPLSSN